MMLHLSVGWTVFDVINQRVASESWKMNKKVRGERWRPTKNPPKAKLVSLWFLMSRKWKEVSECLPFLQISAFIAHLQNSHLPSCKSMVSVETVITVFDTVSFGLIDLTVDDNDSNQFYPLQSEVWCPKRSFLILVLPVSLRMRFPRPDFHGQTSLIRTTIMDEHGVGFFFF